MLLLLLMFCMLKFYELFFFFKSFYPILILNISSIQNSLVDFMLLLVSDPWCGVTSLVMIVLAMGRLRSFVGLKHKVVDYFLFKAVRRRSFLLKAHLGLSRSVHLLSSQMRRQNVFSSCAAWLSWVILMSCRICIILKHLLVRSAPIFVRPLIGTFSCNCSDSLRHIGGSLG